jgi:hypothetical protein
MLGIFHGIFIEPPHPNPNIKGGGGLPPEIFPVCQDIDSMC